MTTATTTRTPARKRFVEIPRARLEAECQEIADLVIAAGGSATWTLVGNERVLEIEPPRTVPRARVRFFTSFSRHGDTARECGADAARVVVTAYTYDARNEWRPIEKPTRILRTAPRDMTERERVDAWLARVREALRDGYRRALAVKACPKCNRALALRPRKDKTGHFLGCIGFPSCRHTESAP